MFLDEFYIRGDDVMVPAHLNFGKYMLDKLRSYGDKVALDFIESHKDFIYLDSDSPLVTMIAEKLSKRQVSSLTNESITYKRFTQYSVNLAASLAALGVGVGDIVAVASEKRINFVPTTLAVVFTGATYTPFDLNFGRSVLKQKLVTIKPKYFIASAQFLEKYGDILRSFDFVETYIVFDDTPSWPDAVLLQSLIDTDVDVQSFEPATVKGQIDPAIILYSSGTTGPSKCIVLSHLSCITSTICNGFLDEDIKTVCIFGEWYHNYDTFMTFKFLIAGVRIAFTNDWTLHEVLKCIEDYRAEIAMVVPYILNQLCKEENLERYNLESLNILYSRSTVLHTKTIEKVKQRLPKLQHVLQGYGMTECGEPTSEVWAKKVTKSGSIGMVAPGITIKVVDIKSGKNLGPNQAGEIRLMGSMFMKEYIEVDSSTYLDEEGFFKTGDMGYYDDDKYFFIIDRIREVIVFKGFKLAPLELEAILEMHDDILEAGVVGAPNSDCDELPTAFVVKKPNSTITEKDILDYIIAEAPSFMQLQGGVKFIEKLPRNPRGKILRRQLRELLN